MLLKLQKLSAVLFAAILFTSCDKSFSEENGNLPGGVEAITGGSPNGDCKACGWVPFCSGSNYIYSDTGFASPGGQSVNYTVNFQKDTTINNKVYGKYICEGSNPAYYNCTAGTTTVISVNGTTIGGTGVEFVKLTLLKANELVGTSWTDVNTISGQTVTYTSTLTAKGMTRIIGGITYAEVMKVHVAISTSAGGGTVAAGNADYYYAKGKGLIENVSIDGISGTTIFHRVLVSAAIP